MVGVIFEKLGNLHVVTMKIKKNEAYNILQNKHEKHNTIRYLNNKVKQFK